MPENIEKDLATFRAQLNPLSSPVHGLGNLADHLDRMITVDGSGHLVIAQGSTTGIGRAQVATLQDLCAAGNRILAEADLDGAPEALRTLLDHERTYHYPGPARSNAVAGATSDCWIKVTTKVWGVKVKMSHAFVDLLTKSVGAVIAILLACGVAAWICDVIAAVLALLCAVLKAVDKGKGVWVNITWLGVPVGMGPL